MSLETVKEAIYDRFETEWAAAGRTEPYALENEAVDPLDSDFNPDGLGWCRLRIEEVGRLHTALGGTGNRKFESRCSIIVECYVEADSGIDDLNAMLETVRTIFEGVYFGGVETFTATPYPLEQPNTGRWFGKMMVCECRYEDVK